MQPGDTLHPGSPSGGDPSKNTGEAVDASASPAAASEATQESATWYHVESQDTGQAPPAPHTEDTDVHETTDEHMVTWTASEFVAHEKSGLWYMGFVFVGAVIAGLTFMLTREIVTVVAVTVALGAFGAMATRRPRVLEYVLDNRGVQIGQKLYSYSSFRSFSLFEDRALHVVDLMPIERFRPLVTVYFPPEQEQQILAKLGDNLPYEQRTPDMVDRLMRRLHF